MRLVCSVCGLPKDLCVCETIAKESQKIRIYTEKRKFGKNYTVVEGINERQLWLSDTLSHLSRKQLESQGWKIFEKSDDKLMAAIKKMEEEKSSQKTEVKSQKSE